MRHHLNKASIPLQSSAGKIFIIRQIVRIIDRLLATKAEVTQMQGARLLAAIVVMENNRSKIRP
jgi:hypothetical protein